MRETECEMHGQALTVANGCVKTPHPHAEALRTSRYNTLVSGFYVENFGCRATQADGAAIERQLEGRGLDRARNPRHADIVVLNTCTVTAAADHDARAAIRRIHRENPGCKILVTGCYAQRAPQEISALPGVTWIVGNSHKHEVGNVVCGSSGFVPLQSMVVGPGAMATQELPSIDHRPSTLVGDIFAHTELLAAPVFGAGADKTRPNLKVQDGCDNRCSFCVIPSVRGQSRSLPLGQVLAQVDELVANGYREVVVSGINLGRWGRDFPKPQKFVTLVRALLERTGLEKLRISSVEPMDWSDELIALVAAERRIAKHAHVPMQSGSDAVLRRMFRKYRPWHYAAKIRNIREAMPDAAIGADVMVGFPGESDAEFEATRKLIEDLPFTYLHVFTYSSRPGTRSAEMTGQVPGPVMKERNRTLRELAAHKKSEFMHGFIGKTIEAISLNQSDTASTEALTDNYLKLRIAGQHAPNQWLPVKVEGVLGDALLGAVE
jgi:threonylcarbamoyladenosine tRNA methylthiotransferase MtaB